VAISMQPDILLADEILAVGDMAFQERCLRRVAEESERGLTVLFVSHDMAAISRLCHRAIWLDKGQVMRDGEPEAVVDAYEEAVLRGREREYAQGEKTGRHSNVVAEIASVRLLNSLGEEVGAAPTAEDVFLRVRLKLRKPGAALRGMIDLYSKRVLAFRTTQPEEYTADHWGIVDLLVRVPAHLLAETTYTVNVTVYTVLGKETKVVLDNALTFLAYGGETGAQLKHGALAPRLDWTVQSHRHVGKQRKSAV
jgi:lipopolysaccharide transport system ATP-binding protein